MKYVFASIVTVLLFVSCNSEIAEPSHQNFPQDVEQLKALLASEQDDIVKLDIYYALYKAHLEIPNMTAAFKYLSLQRELAMEIEDPLKAGRACYNMGLIRKKQFDYIGAVNLYLQAIDFFETVGDQEKIALTLDNIGVVFMETANYEYAKKFYQKTKSIYRTSKKPNHLLLANLNLGICHLAASPPNYDSALMYFQSALTLTEALTENQSYYLNRIHTQLGTMYYRADQYREAIDHYQTSLRYINVNQLKQQAIGFANIGEVYMEQGLYKEAEEWLNKALALSGQIEDIQSVGGVLNILGRLHQLQGDYETGVQYLERAINVASKDVINEHLQESLRLIRESYVALRRANKPVNIERYEKVLIFDARQDLLEQELVDKTNFMALQAALGLSVELDHEKKQKKAEVQLNSLYSYAVVVLLLLVIISGTVLFITGRKIYQVRQVLKW
ncbi:tetratricopeptide repeat protein [Fulvivirga sp. 29W222]|uniref:Tetratricopeptide repeat protein n=1 Tax=Fulvivirga marina TaxID=2494733 RepID=A0A937FXE4_9BACT|nr:tetratricopeptide repeat protein [Fulvivirga marina]MBL6446145.1 tetratricopeptide repeat protein [Fulvivirga marina]